jgi:hypothetical protein
VGLGSIVSGRRLSVCENSTGVFQPSCECGLLPLSSLGHTDSKILAVANEMNSFIDMIVAHTPFESVNKPALDGLAGRDNIKSALVNLPISLPKPVGIFLTFQDRI